MADAEDAASATAPDELGDEMAAFEAEMKGLEDTPKPSLTGPRAPKVIAAAPVRSAPPMAGLPTMGGPRVPVSDWQPPEQLASSIQSEFPGTAMPELGKQPGSSSAALRAPEQESYGEPEYAAAPAFKAPLPVAVSTPAYPPQGYSQPMPGGPPSRTGSHDAAPSGGKAPAKTASASAATTKRYCAGAQWEDKTLLEWPEDDFRIFVGDLGNESNDDVLAHAFSRYPSFQKAKVVRNKQSGKSLGFGFVSFKDPWDMTKALREMHGKYIGNRPVKVRKSTWKDRGLAAKDATPLTHSLAIADKSMKKGMQEAKPGAMRKDKRFGGKKPKNGMPW